MSCNLIIVIFVNVIAGRRYKMNQTMQNTANGQGGMKMEAKKCTVRLGGAMGAFSSEKAADLGEIGRAILSSDYNRIGFCVSEGKRTDEDVLMAAVTLCRRRFKKKDIVLIDILDEEEEGEIGLVFTESACYYWNETFQFSFDYADVTEMDFDDEGMEVSVTAGDSTYTIELTGDEDEYYPRYMYNFIMDIVDAVSDSAKM
jgi:hypothetical protein